MNIILFGFKSCGKTHFGKLLSKELNRPFIDTDDLIIKEYNATLSIREIHEALGETAFRALEEKVVHNLSADTHAVIALGGGTILNPSNSAHLQKIGRLIYLKANFDTVKERILQQALLPSFIDPTNPVESLHKIYQERIPIYEAIPAQSIDMEEI